MTKKDEHAEAPVGHHLGPRLRIGVFQVPVQNQEIEIARDPSRLGILVSLLVFGGTPPSPVAMGRLRGHFAAPCAGAQPALDFATF
jgi:hypothetical protein